ncbi:MAG: formylglycine-generating enzyme family protein [Acidobacteria bacterium]|nr:formylglycine-generating enzyme family protein [Acidobacteriota bacterium]
MSKKILPLLILLVVVCFTSQVNSQEKASTSLLIMVSKPADKPLKVGEFFGIKFNDILVPETVALTKGVFKRGFHNPNLGCQECSRDEQPVKEITVSAFELGRFEVTNAQYEVFAKASGRENADWVKFYTRGKENYPVANVSWSDAQAYCAWLQSITGREYRLPTEAEWEYAARAASTTVYPNGNELTGSEANFNRSGPDRVDKYKPNRFGIYNMIGNVWEWCSDWYGEFYYSESPEIDPQGPSTGQYRVLRGGGWSSAPDLCRVSNRFWHNPGFILEGRGFRVAVSIKKTN